MRCKQQNDLEIRKERVPPPVHHQVRIYSFLSKLLNYQWASDASGLHARASECFPQRLKKQQSSSKATNCAMQVLSDTQPCRKDYRLL